MVQAKKTVGQVARENDMAAFLTHKEDIRKAADQAKTTMADAASLAAKAIAEAAGQAKVAIAEAAAVSVKVLSVKNADDHDLLIKLNTLMDGLKEDIRDLKSGTSLKIEDHESRIKTLESKTSNYTITLALYTLAVLGMISLTIYHILSK